MVTFTQLAADPFDRADENPINPAVWSLQNSANQSQCQLLGNECVSTSDVQACGDIYTGITWPDDQYAELRVDALSGVEDSTGIFVRSDVDAQTGYFAFIQGPPGPSYEVDLFRVVAGNSQLLTSFIVALALGDVLRIEAQGSLISVKVNEVLLGSATDSTTSSGSPAFFVSTFGAVTDVAISHFAAGSITEQEDPPRGPSGLNEAVPSDGGFLTRKDSIGSQRFPFRL
jgi:hypothetical protein